MIYYVSFTGIKLISKIKNNSPILVSLFVAFVALAVAISTD
jgi:hypothetical protein